MIATPLATSPAVRTSVAATAPAAEPAPEAAGTAATWPPNVWKRDQVGLGLGTKWAPLGFGTAQVGTEFGRGRLGLVAAHGYDLYYEATADAIRAASYLSAGQQGAITVDHANFIGAELRTVDVGSDGNGQVPNPRAVPYRFEERASSEKGRRQLESELKLDGAQVLIDGRWIAVANQDGSVKILEALKYVTSLEAGEG